MRHGRSAFELLLVLISVVAIALFLYGTFGSKKRSMGNAILVVDSHQVYKDLGRDLSDLQAQQQEATRLEDQLKAVQQEITEEIAAKKAELGESPTEEQREVLVAMERDAAVRMNAEISKSKQALAKLDRQLRQQFRNAIKPVADVIAAEKGASLVLIASPEFILSVDQSVFITDAVVQAMQEQTPDMGF
jgi:E3 ubiquitin-protein ligase DOA10